MDKVYHTLSLKAIKTYWKKYIVKFRQQVDSIILMIGCNYYTRRVTLNHMFEAMDKTK